LVSSQLDKYTGRDQSEITILINIFLTNNIYNKGSKKIILIKKYVIFNVPILKTIKIKN